MDTPRFNYSGIYRPQSNPNLARCSERAPQVPALSFDTNIELHNITKKKSITEEEAGNNKVLERDPTKGVNTLPVSCSLTYLSFSFDL